MIRHQQEQEELQRKWQTSERKARECAEKNKERRHRNEMRLIVLAILAAIIIGLVTAVIEAGIWPKQAPQTITFDTEEEA